MEKFFEAGTLTDEELDGRPAHGDGRRQALPARLHVGDCSTSASSRCSTRSSRCLPSPAERPFKGVGQGRRAKSRRKADDKAPAAAFVWKTIADPFAGRITMFRVVSGTLEVRLDRPQQDQGRARAPRHLRAAAGKDADAGARDQGRRSRRGRQAEGHADQRHARRQDRPGHRFRRSKFPEPVLSYAIEPKSRGDEDKISTSMHRLEEEDPSIQLQPRSADQGAAALRPGTAAHRGHRRQAEAPLRRRRQS